uniref:Uncharacterized protein n=1 Tax=Setaria italica TaxID=4555 RepID=K3XTW7_SETIT
MCIAVCPNLLLVSYHNMVPDKQTLCFFHIMLMIATLALARSSF